MGILDRLSRLIRANINDLIKRAEDPEKIIEQALEDMRATLRDARMEVAEAMAELKKLERDQHNYAEQARAWELKAADALKWAARTYVVAALSSLAMLLYYLMLFLGRRD